MLSDINCSFREVVEASSFSTREIVVFAEMVASLKRLWSHRTKQRDCARPTRPNSEKLGVRISLSPQIKIMRFYDYVNHLLDIRKTISEYRGYFVGSGAYSPVNVEALIKRFDDLLKKDPKEVNWNFLVSILTKTCGWDIWVRALSKEALKEFKKEIKKHESSRKNR